MTLSGAFFSFFFVRGTFIAKNNCRYFSWHGMAFLAISVGNVFCVQMQDGSIYSSASVI